MGNRILNFIHDIDQKNTKYRRKSYAENIPRTSFLLFLCVMLKNTPETTVSALMPKCSLKSLSMPYIQIQSAINRAADVIQTKDDLKLSSLIGNSNMGLSLFDANHYAATKTTSSSLFMTAPTGKSGARMIETDENFLEMTANPDPSNLPILIFFSAPWCGPCRLSNPVVKDIMKQFTGKIDVLEVCTDDLPDVASDADVVSIPTIQIYHAGVCLDTIVGCVAKNVLANAVQKVLDDIYDR